MSVSEGLVDLLKDQLASLAPVTARRMFSGAGIFANGLMFALVVDDTLYLKTDEVNRPTFEAEGLAPFSFMKQGRRIDTSYLCAPERLLDDADELLEWSRRALKAAGRAATRKPAGKTRQRRTPS